MPYDSNPDVNRNADIKNDREQIGHNSEEDLVGSSDDEFEDVDELAEEEEDIEER